MMMHADDYSLNTF